MGDFAAPALLIVTLAALLWFQRNDVKNFAAFAQITDTGRRQRTFLKWAVRSCAFYLGVPLLGLVLIGRIDAIWHFPNEFLPAAHALPPLDSEVLKGMGLGLLISGPLIPIAILIRRRRRRKPGWKPVELKIAPMMPRNRDEALRLVPLILNAGVSEEIFSRLYIPLLMILSGLDALTAFVATTILFGLLHRYQGWIGIVLTTILGGIFALAYLAVGGLWLPVLLHLLLNSNSLLLQPALKRFGQPSDD